MQQQRWYRPDDGFYSKIISILGKTNQLNRAVWLFKEMKKQGCRPDTSVFNSLINAHIRNSSNKEIALVKALKYFEYMKTTRHCKPNLVTYNTLLRACAQAKEHKRLEQLFEEMCQEGIKPDICTFNGIIDAHGKAGEFSAMVSMFRKMRKCKIKPDYMTYNSMIDAYGKAGLITEMEEALEDMATSKVKPQLSTLNSLINNYGAAKRVDLMELVVQNMSALGIHPSLITYEVLIKGYGNSGCFEKLRTCLEAMLDAGVMPETTTLNAVMEVYSNNGLFKEAENLLDNVAVMPTELTYLILYRGYLKHGRVDKIDALIERMNAAGIVPNDKFLMHSLEFATLDPKSRTSRDVAKDSSNNAKRVSMHLENSRTIPKSA
ncbi:hypothetical protein KP509_21G045800 [Ceratopteris richardii]|nr:hypothetical protein KP509_21G045800 [Ceratopteris richardii]